MLFNSLFGAETRAQTFNLSDAAAWSEAFGTNSNIAGVSVTEDSAMGVSAIWSAVNLVAGTLSHLPLHLYRESAEGVKEKAKNDPLYTVIHNSANDVHTKADFWRWVGNRLMLEGRAVALLVKNRAGRVTALIPLELSRLTIEQAMSDGKLLCQYRYTPETGRQITYSHSDVVDFNLYPRADGFSHRNPITTNRNSIGCMIAAESYASALLANGGTPPLALTMPPSSPRGQEKAANDIQERLGVTTKLASAGSRKVIPLPAPFDIKPIGIDPQKQQLIELRTFQIAEAARIFNCPPALLHDLTNGSYSNFSQQSLNFAQMTMIPIVETIESEMNRKLFGARNSSNYVEFDMGGLLRGDLKSRMESYTKAVASGILTPNEVREMENRVPIEGGDEAYIQGATITLKTAAKGGFTNQNPAAGDEPDDTKDDPEDGSQPNSDDE